MNHNFTVNLYEDDIGSEFHRILIAQEGTEIYHQTVKIKRNDSMPFCMYLILKHLDLIHRDMGFRAAEVLITRGKYKYTFANTYIFTELSISVKPNYAKIALKLTTR